MGTGQFVHSSTDREGLNGRYHFDESVTLDPGQEIEVAMVAPEMPATMLFLNGRLKVFGDKERVIIPRIQWGDRHREAEVILPGESIFIALKNISEEKATIRLCLDLPARRCTDASRRQS